MDAGRTRVLASAATNVHAWQPNVDDLDKAVKSGDFTAYFTKISAWINQKATAAPKKMNETIVKARLSGPFFANTLSQRQLIDAESSAASAGVLCSPAIAGGCVYIGNDRGTLFCFGHCPTEPRCPPSSSFPRAQGIPATRQRSLPRPAGLTSGESSALACPHTL